MFQVDSSLAATLVALAGTILAIAVLVQVVQEVYKYLTSSKGRAYEIALVDFLGPWGKQLMRPNVLPDMRVRGPFQFKRIKPEGVLLPLKEDELASALERTAPAWVQRGLASLRAEVDAQKSAPGVVSPAWKTFLAELSRAEQGAPGYWTAGDIKTFLQGWEHTGNGDAKDPLVAPAALDAAGMLSAYRAKFLSHVDDAVERYPQLSANFEYAYARRNTRQTFVLALLVVLLFNFPIDRLYDAARHRDDAGTLALTQQMLGVYERTLDRHERDPQIASYWKTILSTQDSLLKARVVDAGQDVFMPEVNAFATVSDRYNKGGIVGIGTFLFGCFVTALLVSFGAPLWNDIASSLLRLQKGWKSPPTTISRGDND
jgi:hypothetical protein